MTSPPVKNGLTTCRSTVIISILQLSCACCMVELVTHRQTQQVDASGKCVASAGRHKTAYDNPQSRSSIEAPWLVVG